MQAKYRRVRQLDSDEEEEEGGEGGVAQEGQESESKEEPILEEDLTQERDVFGDSDDEDVTESHVSEKAVTVSERSAWPSV